MNNKPTSLAAFQDDLMQFAFTWMEEEVFNTAKN
jgi:hypothetical protein